MPDTSDKLFMIPIVYEYGGGFSALIRAKTIEEARKIAEKFDDYYENWSEHYDEINNCTADEHDFGNIDDFKYGLISYYE